MCVCVCGVMCVPAELGDAPSNPGMGRTAGEQGGGRNEKKNDKDEERVVYIIVVVTKYNSKFLLLGFSFFLVARLALFPPTVTQLTVSLLM